MSDTRKGKWIVAKKSTPGFPNRNWYAWEYADGTRCPISASSKAIVERAIEERSSRKPKQESLF